MEILWPALGICVIVIFVFFVLAQHWQKVLRHQTWTIRRLTDRVRDLEEMGDPEFRRRLSESAPVPLEQVYNFSFRLSEDFWNETLGLSEEDRAHVRAHGSFPGSVKLERWRSHTVASVTEVLPECKTAQWRTRTLDFYPESANGTGTLKLWEVSLARPDGTAMMPPSLELSLRGNFLELSGHFLPPHGFRRTQQGRANGNNGSSATEDETLIFRVPLEAAQLAEYRSLDPMRHAGNGSEATASGIEGAGSGWQAFYSDLDEGEGWEWHLWLRDLSKKAEWERWKILETAVVKGAET